MLKIKRTNIYLTRGDSAYITLGISGVEPSAADVVRCQVRKEPTGGELIIDAVAEQGAEDPTQYLWYIRPADTAELTPGEYYWDAQIEIAESGDIFSFVPVSSFIILDEVTEVDNG